MPVPSLKNEIIWRIVDFVAVHEQQERAGNDHNPHSRMRRRDLLALLEGSSIVHNMAVPLLYESITTDRPGELVAGFLSRRAHANVPSKRENLGRIRRLTLEYPDLYHQPSYTDVMRADAYDWRQTVDSPNASTGTYNLYVANYEAFTAELRYFYRSAAIYTPGPLLRLDTLVFCRDTYIKRYDDCPSGLANNDMLFPEAACEFLLQCQVKHFCLRTSRGALRLPDADLSDLAHHGLQAVTVHLTDPSARPPFIYKHPAIWSFDPRRFPGDDPIFYEEQFAHPEQKWEIAQAATLRWIERLLQSRTLDPPGSVSERARPDDNITLKVYASPYELAGWDFTHGSRELPPKLDAQMHRIETNELDGDVRGVAGGGDELRWLAAIDAPTCPACGWVAQAPLM